MKAHVSVRVCGVFNIIAGCAGGCFGLLMYGLKDLRLGAGPSEVMVMAYLALLLAGVLSAISGVCLLFSSERARNVAIGLLALAVVLSLIFSVVFVLEAVVGVEPIVVLTGLVALLGIVELFYLWRQRSVK